MVILQLIQFSRQMATISHLLTVLALPLLVRFIAKPEEINPPQHCLIFFSTTSCLIFLCHGLQIEKIISFITTFTDIIYLLVQDVQDPHTQLD